jgi:hypothetical protein
MAREGGEPRSEGLEEESERELAPLTLSEFVLPKELQPGVTELASRSRAPAADRSAGAPAHDHGPHAGHRAPTGSQLRALCLSALGIVFGDIGTSPLYALRECFSREHGVSVTQDNVLGVLSLIFWALTITVSLKYVVYVLRADNRGEGGILALMALATSRGHLSGLVGVAFVAMGLFGAALLYGDGMITPAISVLSAVEGLQVVQPGFASFVVPITVIILVLLFMVQKHGTAKVGGMFGPVTLVWFIVLAALGAWHISDNLAVSTCDAPPSLEVVGGLPGPGSVNAGQRAQRQLRPRAFG